MKLIDDKAEVASCRTLAGTGKPGFKDGPGRLESRHRDAWRCRFGKWWVLSPSTLPLTVWTGYTAEFNEPRGIGYDQSKNRAYVCDSNNHAIRVIDVERATVSTLSLQDWP